MLKVAICDDSDRDASQLEHYLLSYDKFPLEQNFIQIHKNS